MVWIKYISRSFWVLFSLQTLVLQNTLAATHSEPAKEAFQRIYEYLEYRTKLEKGCFRSTHWDLQSLKRTFQTMTPSTQLTSDYDFLTGELSRQLSRAQDLWISAENNPELNEDTIRTADLLIQEVGLSLLGDRSSRLSEISPLFHRYVVSDLVSKGAIQQHCITYNAPALATDVLTPVAMLLPTPMGYLFGGLLGCFSCLCHATNTPREIFCPTLSPLESASKDQAESLLRCQSGPTTTCWPAPGELRARAQVAQELHSRLREMAVQNVVESDFLLLILAAYYQRTSFSASLTNQPAPAGPTAGLLVASAEISTEELATAPSPARDVEKNTCAICLEVETHHPIWGKMSHSRCGHAFHETCFSRWINSKIHNPTCPICRSPAY